MFCHNEFLIKVPAIIYISCVMIILFYQSIPCTLFVIGLATSAEVLNKYLKKFLQRTMGKQHPLGRRPNPRGNGHPSVSQDTLNKTQCRGCGVFPCTKPSRSYGMPSGHAHTIAFTVIFGLLYVFYETDYPLGIKRFLVLIGLGLVLCVCKQRVDCGCHSTLQVTLGTILGSVLGWLFFHFWRYLLYRCSFK